MLLGHWKNIRELESELNLNELELIVGAARDREMRQQRFMAALKGINLDEGEAVNKVDEIKRRIEAEQAGVSVDQLDFMDMGIEIESE